MKYLLKEDMAEMIRTKYKNNYIVDKLHLTKTYVSLVFNRKKPIQTKHTPKQIKQNYLKKKHSLQRQ